MRAIVDALPVRGFPSQLAAVSFLCLASCGSPPGQADSGAALDAGERDGETLDGDAQPAADPREGAALAQADLRFSLPAAGTEYVRGSVDFQLVSERAEADRVQLFLDGALHATLALPFSYAWDTDAVPEGTYQWSATALVDGEPVGTTSRTFTVDRTPPRVIALEHASGLGAVDLNQPILLVFSEPVRSEDLTAVFGSTGAVGVRATEDPARFSLQLEFDSLPADLDIVVPQSVRDLSGLPLSAAFSARLNVPAWCEMARAVRAAAVGSDGTTLWAALESGTDSSFELGLARWQGGAFSAPIGRIPGRVRRPMDAAIRTTMLAASNGYVAMASSQLESFNASALDVLHCEGGARCTLLPRATAPADLYAAELRTVAVSDDGRVLLSTTTALSGGSRFTYEGGAWINPSASLAADIAGAYTVDYERAPTFDLVVYAIASANPQVPYLGIAQKSGEGAFVHAADSAAHDAFVAFDGTIYVLGSADADGRELYRLDDSGAFTRVATVPASVQTPVTAGSETLLVGTDGAFDLLGARVSDPMPTPFGNATIWNGRVVVESGGDVLIANRRL